MQLVAYGAQDIYLTSNPQVTMFKVVHRRHTNFSMESIQQTFNGTADFGKKVSCTISRSADLVMDTWLEATLPAISVTYSSTGTFTILGQSTVLSAFHWVNWIGHKLIYYAEVEIGGQRIDRHYGEWMHIWNQLTETAEKESAYALMVGNSPLLTTTPLPQNSGDNLSTAIPATKLMIPLRFWFCRNPGLALPLIALQYHEVKINIEFASLADCIYCLNSSGSDTSTTFNNYISLSDVALWVNYVYLDTEERRKFAQVPHEYLIEQVQYNGEETNITASNKLRLALNHPTKEIVWVTQVYDCVQTTSKQWFNFSMAPDSSFQTGTPADPYGQGMFGPFLTNGFLTSGLALGTSGTQYNQYLNMTANTGFDFGQNPTNLARIQLNGQDRFQERTGDYFCRQQPYSFHTRCPEIGINVYSFALRAEEHQPSGTCNFSRVDNANLMVTLNTTDLYGTTRISSSLPAKTRIYAVNYNVLRIMSGMGGLAYN